MTDLGVDFEIGTERRDRALSPSDPRVHLLGDDFELGRVHLSYGDGRLHLLGSDFEIDPTRDDRSLYFGDRQLRLREADFDIYRSANRQALEFDAPVGPPPPPPGSGGLFKMSGWYAAGGDYEVWLAAAPNAMPPSGHMLDGISYISLTSPSGIIGAREIDINLPFSHDTASPFFLFTAQAGDLLWRASVVIQTGFHAGTTMQLGSPASPALVLASGSITATAPGEYRAGAEITFNAPTTLQLAIALGGAGGTGYVHLIFRR